MTAAEKQTVDMLLELVKANDCANTREHGEIKGLIVGLRGDFGQARDFTLSMKTIGKFLLGLASTAAVVTGAVAGIQALLVG